MIDSEAWYINCMRICISNRLADQFTRNRIILLILQD